jgi:hypothetical protein
VQRIVLHTLGGPFYGQPDRRWAFFTPAETFRLWRRPSFGAHWIVWRDGSIWPRHVEGGEPLSFTPPLSPGSPGEAPGLDPLLARRLVREAAPVYSHVAGANSRTVGIEIAHSGRTDDPFPPEQARAAAWLVSSLLALSQGRLGPQHVVGHKDLDRKPAYVGDRCSHADCLAYADGSGRPYRRRVDPPEALFDALAREGMRVPRGTSEGDAELLRAEAIPGDAVPATLRAARTGASRPRKP